MYCLMLIIAALLLDSSIQQRILVMSQAKRNKYYLSAIEGLKSANKGNPFWSRSDAMQTLNMARGIK